MAANAAALRAGSTSRHVDEVHGTGHSPADAIRGLGEIRFIITHAPPEDAVIAEHASIAEAAMMTFHSTALVRPSMIQTLKEHWHLFLRSPPGQRFQDVHKRQKAKHGGSVAKRKHGLVIAGIAICVLGVVALPLPGPGTLVLAGGLMMLAAESIVVAKALDRADKVRARLMSKMRQTCQKLGTAKCVLLSACAAALFIGAAAALWVWLT